MLLDVARSLSGFGRRLGWFTFAWMANRFVGFDLNLLKKLEKDLSDLSDSWFKEGCIVNHPGDPRLIQIRRPKSRN